MYHYAYKVNVRLCDEIPLTNIFYPLINEIYKLRLKNVTKKGAGLFFKKIYKYINPYFMINHLLYCCRKLCLSPTIIT